MARSRSDSRPSQLSITSHDSSPASNGKRTHTPMGEKFRVSSSPDKPRRTTRKSALPLSFDGKHLKKLLDHYCTAEQLDSWVQSSPVVSILKNWVGITLQCHEHEDGYRALLLPAESDEKWSDFKEDCAHLAVTRIRGEDPGEPAPDAITEAWSQAIEQLVRDSWKDAVSGRLNGGEKPGYFDGWPCERACDLLQTIYEDLRKEPDSGYFANLLSAFAGQRHLPPPPEPRSDAASKPACETCRFNHIACDRAEPMCRQCRHSKVLCVRADFADNHTGDTTDEETLRLKPTPKPLSRLMLKPLPSEIHVEPFSEMQANPNTPACKTCRLKHRGCDRIRPICGECATKGVFCIWDRDGSRKSSVELQVDTAGSAASGEAELARNAETDNATLEEGEIEEESGIAKIPQQSGPKRVLVEMHNAPIAKRPRTMSDFAAPLPLQSPAPLQLPEITKSAPSATENMLHQAPIAPMMAPLPSLPSMQPIQPTTFGKVHLDRLARIGLPSSPTPPSIPNHPAENLKSGRKGKNKKKGPGPGTSANMVKLSTTRTSIKAEFDKVSNAITQTQPQPVPTPFLAQLSNALQGGQTIQRLQTKRSGDPFPATNRPNGIPTGPKVGQPTLRPSASSEEARLSSSLQYCQTLFEDILAGRNPLNAARMGVTAIQHALGKD